jgi:secreted trypsin-like serine protease
VPPERLLLVAQGIPTTYYDAYTDGWTKRTLLVYLSSSALLCVPIITVVVADEDATAHQRRLGGPDTRIINGQDARRGRFPWWVFLRGPADCGGDSCGGALIAPDLVLTAAHCGGCINRGEIGKYDTSDRQEGGSIRLIESSLPHPNWEGEIPYNDIMIVKLDGTVANAQPIRLNFDENVPSETGETLLMLGLGSITDGVNEPVQRATILQEAPTEYFAFEDCAVATDPTNGSAFGNSLQNTAVTGDWFCTIINEPERYAHCFGDSGGPIIIEGSSASEDVLVAIISGYAFTVSINDLLSHVSLINSLTLVFIRSYCLF